MIVDKWTLFNFRLRSTYTYYFYYFFSFFSHRSVDSAVSTHLCFSRFLTRCALIVFKVNDQLSVPHIETDTIELWCISLEWILFATNQLLLLLLLFIHIFYSLKYLISWQFHLKSKCFVFIAGTHCSTIFHFHEFECSLRREKKTIHGKQIPLCSLSL